MRDIKFRAQQFDHGKNGFQYGSYVTDNKDYHAIVKESKNSPDEMYNMLINPETLGQFTGLTDKNGVDIYEGDIVKDDNGYSRAVSIGPFGVDAEDYDSGDYYEGQVPDTFPWLKFEVIGNIHSNPELLEK